MNSRNVRTPLGIARRGFFCQFEAIQQEAVEGKGEWGWSCEVGLKRLDGGGEHAVRGVVPGSGPAKSAEGAGSYLSGGGSVLENLE